MPKYELTVMVHLNVGREVEADSLVDAMAKVEEAMHLAYGGACALAEVVDWEEN